MMFSNSKRIFPSKCLTVLIAAVTGILCGCAENRHAIVAVTGTNIGLEISENPATQMPQGKLGYQRSEIAIVPTNRSAGVDAKKDGKGAEDLGDVLMELRFANIFSFTSGGIYQRLAVGENAVKQAGASLMFARDKDGKIDQNTVNAIKNLQGIPEVEKPDILSEKSKLRKVFVGSSDEDKQKIRTAVETANFGSWDEFLKDAPKKATIEDINKIKENLNGQGINF